MPDVLLTSAFDSPIGPLALACDEAGRLRGVSFAAGLTGAMGREYPGAAMRAGEMPEAVAAAKPASIQARLAASRAGYSIAAPGGRDGSRSSGRLLSEPGTCTVRKATPARSQRAFST